MSSFSQREILQSLVQGEQLDALSQGRNEEYLQPLMDLGYLARHKFKPELIQSALGTAVHENIPVQLLKIDIQLALANFRTEAMAVGMLSAQDVGLDVAPEEDPELTPGTIELDLLHRLLSLDGEPWLLEIPELGEEGILVRVLQYQAHVLGLQASWADGRFGQETLNGLNQVQSWLGLSEIRNLLPLLADIDKMVESVLGSEQMKKVSPMVVYFSFPYEGMHRLGTSPRHFQKQLKQSIGIAKYKLFRDWVHPTRIFPRHRLLEPEKVAAQSIDPCNLFLARLVQVLQWVRGYYSGKLDSVIAKMTLQSLDDYAETLDLETGRVLFRVGRDEGDRDFWAMDFTGLFRQVYADEGKAKHQNLIHVLDGFEEKLSGYPEKVRMRVGSFMEVTYGEHALKVKSDLLQGRRVYYGIRNMAKSISLGLEKIFHWIIEGLNKAKHLIANMVKLFFRQIREGMRTFARGLAFLFAGRESKSYSGDGKLLAVSGFLPDFDFIQAISPNVSAEVLNKHFARVSASVDSLYDCLAITGKLIHWVVYLAVGPVAWTALALRVARLMIQFLAEKLRLRRKAFNQAIANAGNSL